MVQRRRTQAESGGVSELRKCCWERRPGEYLKFSGQSIGEKKAAQRKAPGICGESPLSLQLSTNKHLHVRKLTKVGE